MNTKQSARVVLITGASGGLGAAVVQAFADDGARLVLTARRRAELEALAASLGLGDERVLIAPANLTDADAVAALVQAAVARFGAVDVLVHVTGGYQAGATVPDTALATWQGMLDLNITSAFIVARAVLPGMLERGHGALVFVSSRAASQAAPRQAAYAVSKGALELLVQNLAAETRHSGVNVNAVSPSIIDTPANRSAMPKADAATWVSPESLAGVIRFLASEAARDIHGAIVPVPGRA